MRGAIGIVVRYESKVYSGARAFVQYYNNINKSRIIEDINTERII